MIAIILARQTCAEAWAPVAEILKANGFLEKKVWQPFYYDGKCAEYVRELGFKSVHHEPGEDFFVFAKNAKFLQQKCDFILDNPPYTNPETKQKVLKALLETEKPFCVLLPIAILHSAYLRENFDLGKVQTIMPRKVMVKKTNQDAVPFKLLVWLCYGMGLKRDLYLL